MTKVYFTMQLGSMHRTIHSCLWSIQFKNNKKKHTLYLFNLYIHGKSVILLCFLSVCPVTIFSKLKKFRSNYRANYLSFYKTQFSKLCQSFRLTD